MVGEVGRAAAVLDMHFLLLTSIQAEFAVHEALVNIFPRNPKLEKAPGRALHDVEDSLGISVALAHVASSNVP